MTKRRNPESRRCGYCRQTDHLTVDCPTMPLPTAEVEARCAWDTVVEDTETLPMFEAPVRDVRETV